MNMGLIAPQIYPCKTGGLEIFNNKFVKNLAKRGHKINLFTICKNNFKNRNVKKINISNNLFRANMITVYPNLLFNVLKYQKEIDLLHIPYTSNSKLAYPTFLLHKITNIPYVIRVTGVGHQWHHEFWQKKFFENADKITSVSNSLKEEYENRVNKDIKVTPTRMPFRKSTMKIKDLRSKHGLKENDKIILCLGSIKKLKGNDILLEAFMKLGKDFIDENNLKLLFVGDGELRPKLEKKVELENFTDKVEFLGQIPYEEVPDIYKLSDIYVIPSLHEANPISLREALFNKLPAIGSDTMGINEIINDGENGFLFEVENPNDLKEKIIKVVENCEDIKNRINFDEEYSFEDMVDEYIEIYRDIIESN